MYAIAAYGVQCLAAGCRGSGTGQQGVRPGRAPDDGHRSVRNMLSVS